jgi:hypothetical protein
MRLIKPIRNLDYTDSGSPFEDTVKNLRTLGYKVRVLDESEYENYFYLSSVTGRVPKGRLALFADKRVRGCIFDADNPKDKYPYFSDEVVFDLHSWSTKLKHFRLKVSLPKNEKEFKYLAMQMRCLRMQQKAIYPNLSSFFERY